MPDPTAPPAPPATLKKIRVDNPLVLTTWDRHSFMTALVMLQASSGRHGEDAIEKAASTVVAYEKWLATQGMKL